MSADAWHLAINHLPVVLSLVGAIAAVMAFVLGRRSVLLYAAATLLAAGAASWPALRTGHNAAEELEGRWYANAAQIRVHHDTAENAHLLAIGTAVLALLCVWRTTRAPREAKPSALLSGVLLLASASSATAMGWASWQGEYIVSKNPTLIKSSAPPAATPPAATAPAATSPATMDHSGH